MSDWKFDLVSTTVFQSLFLSVLPVGFEFHLLRYIVCIEDNHSVSFHWLIVVFRWERCFGRGDHCGIHIFKFLCICLWESARTFDFVQWLIVAKYSTHFEYRINTLCHDVCQWKNTLPCCFIMYRLFTSVLSNLCNGCKLFHGTCLIFLWEKGILHMLA